LGLAFNRRVQPKDARHNNRDLNSRDSLSSHKIIRIDTLSLLLAFGAIAVMSDSEDDMDVDLPQLSSDITAGKGKRIAADLPVEAEDNLPWYSL